MRYHQVSTKKINNGLSSVQRERRIAGVGSHTWFNKEPK